MSNCKKNYIPHTYCTVDEQLLGFRGKCSFRMYIPSKPDKYGLKIVTLNDAMTSYLIVFLLIILFVMKSTNSILIYVSIYRYMVFHILEKLTVRTTYHYQRRFLRK